MKFRDFSLTLFAATLCSLSSVNAADSDAGIVNFATCVSDSKYGKQEQEAFDNIKDQMTSLITDLETQLQDIAGKFQDPEFVDSLSPEAEQEMKARFQTLNEELARYQNQYYQVMNQANMKLVQLLSSYVSQASESVAKDHGINFVLNKDACFYFQPSQDITASVVAEMDKAFEKDAKNPSATVTEASENLKN